MLSKFTDTVVNVKYEPFGEAHKVCPQNVNICYLQRERTTEVIINSWSERPNYLLPTYK